MYDVVSDSPVSRRVRTASWLDLRLVAGIVLVLGSVLVGVKVVSAADHTSRYWTAARDLAPGTVLQSGDLRSSAVRVPGAADAYYPVSTDPIGQTVESQVRAGELLPRSAVGATPAAMTVIIPLGGDDAPKIAIGQRITVWVSTARCPSAIVLADVAVQDLQGAHSGSLEATGGEDVIVRVAPGDAERVIQARALDGGVLRAVIVDGPPGSSAALPDLATCVVSGS
jgi:hypothetical protein